MPPPKINSNYATGREKLYGHLASVLFALLIAGSFSLGDLAAPHLSPSALNGIRFIVAVIVMVTIYRVYFAKFPQFPKAPWRFLILGILMATYFITMFFALQLTSPVSTGAVFTLTPLMTAVIAWILMRQRTSMTVFISLLVAAVGAVWVIFHGDLEAISNFRIGYGEAVFILGCFCHAAVAPLIKFFNRGEPGLYFTLWAVVATMVCILLFAAGDLLTLDLAGLPVIVWIVIGYLSIFTTAGTFFLVQFASMRLPSSKVLSYGYLTPCFVIILEGIIGHGWASFSVMAGSLVTAMALVVMAFLKDG